MTASTDELAPATDPPRPASPSHGDVKGTLLPVAVGLLIGSIFVSVFLAAFHDPRPHGLPVAVVGSPQLQAQAERISAAGEDAFSIRTYATAADASAAVQRADVYGAVITSAAGRPSLVVAGAQGNGVTSTLQQAFSPLAGPSAPLAVEDVAPTSAGDSRGLSVFYTAFGVVLAGFLFGLTSMQTAPRLPSRLRAASLVGFSTVIGLAVAAIVEPAYGSLPAPYALTAVVAGLLALAVATTTVMLLRVFGRAGTFVAAIVLLIAGNATSTGVLPAQYLPGWLEPLAGWLPAGVAVRALRGAAYFDDDGVRSGLLVLLLWVLVAAGAYVIMDRLAARHAPAPA